MLPKAESKILVIDNVSQNRLLELNRTVYMNFYVNFKEIVSRVIERARYGRPRLIKPKSQNIRPKN